VPEADFEWARWAAIRGASVGAVFGLVAFASLFDLPSEPLVFLRNPFVDIAAVGALALGAIVGSRLGLAILGLAYVGLGIVGLYCLDRVPRLHKPEQVLLEDDVL
jgi:hypothetical protein